MTPAPKATPATEAVIPAQESNGKKLLPIKPRPEPITSSAPITHIRSFNASGFHLATRDLPPMRPRQIVHLALSQRSLQVHLVHGMHASCNSNWCRKLLMNSVIRAESHPSKPVSA